MINIITDDLPSGVLINGINVPFCPDHKSCIRAVSALVDDTEVDEQDAAYKALNAFYAMVPETVEIDTLFSAMLDFLSGPPVPVLPGQRGKCGENVAPMYSFLYDQQMIFAAFMQQYHIDLTEKTLHWWKFKALLNNLTGNPMAEVMCIRSAEETPDMDNKERKRVRENRKHWAVPVRTESDKRSDAVAAALLSGNLDDLEVALGRK